MDEGRVVPDARGVFVAAQLRRKLPAASPDAGDPDAGDPDAGWGLDALTGRLVEVSGTGATTALTMVAQLLWEAQRRGELAAWVTAQNSIFFPPDLRAGGVDLSALPVVRVASASEVARAAETLLRSGGFALVVLDLGRQQSMSLAAQTRLAGLVRRHDATLLALTRKQSGRSSLGSLVAVRAECVRQSGEDRQFGCGLRILKDKRGGLGESRQRSAPRYAAQCRGPDGVC